ncbi:MAG: hypothetical protein A3E82_05765 [Gammaproteobacteria bacterium RIFCSPHIGHO2_12_FULL_38_11]|nr:MAG: hypothetical protein A3E82_05765 [Gammaproteobacteria bacterium RIFCSPHIGHO2_12_FULL_38_11]
MKKKPKHTDFSQLGENITALMKHCEIDASGLSMETGLPTSTISRLRSNTTDFNPNISSLIPIARYFEISVSQLIGEEALPQDICGTFKPNNINKRFIPAPHSDDIAAYLSGTAPDNMSFIEIDLPVSSKAFAYFAGGNAMEPQFPDKTLLIIDPELAAENLDFVLIMPQGKKIPMLRQLFTDGEDKFLRTLNPMFNEFIKIVSNNYKIIGVVAQARMSFKHFETYLINA